MFHLSTLTIPTLRGSFTSLVQGLRMVLFLYLNGGFRDFPASSRRTGNNHDSSLSSMVTVTTASPSLPPGELNYILTIYIKFSPTPSICFIHNCVIICKMSLYHGMVGLHQYVNLDGLPFSAYKQVNYNGTGNMIFKQSQYHPTSMWCQHKCWF